MDLVSEFDAFRSGVSTADTFRSGVSVDAADAAAAAEGDNGLGDRGRLSPDLLGTPLGLGGTPDVPLLSVDVTLRQASRYVRVDVTLRQASRYVRARVAAGSVHHAGGRWGGVSGMRDGQAGGQWGEVSGMRDGQTG